MSSGRGHNTLTFYGDGDRTAVGDLEVDWELELDAREWGIKDISVSVLRLVLDGWYEEPDEQGYMRQTEDTFHYEYPEDVEQLSIGPDVDAPTPDNVYRMSKPKWTIVAKIDLPREDLRFVAQADVDLARHHIEITF